MTEARVSYRCSRAIRQAEIEIQASALQCLCSRQPKLFYPEKQQISKMVYNGISESRPQNDEIEEVK